MIMTTTLVYVFISLLVLSSSAQNVYQPSSLGYPLIQSSSGYLIHINLQGSSLSASTSNTGYMLIATYPSKTILMSTSSTSNCAGFMQYNCADNSLCVNIIAAQSTTPASTTYSSPYFTVQLGNPVTGLVQVSQASSASSTSQATSTAFPINAVELASSCQTNEFSTFGQGAYGVIGLENRSATDLFAVYINQTSNNAILFQSNIDFGYAATASPILRLPTSYTSWTVSGAGSIYAGQSSITFSSRNLIFDINSDAIGLSADIFSSFLTMLSSQSITNCYGEYLPICTYSGSISSLPNIIIGVGGQNITIPPQVYVKGYGGIPSSTTAITLNFKLIDSSGTGPNYVTGSYSNNTIILDSNFMKYYFTVFNGVGSTIDLYLATNPTGTETITSIDSTPSYQTENSAQPAVTTEEPVATESTSTSLNLTVIVVGSLSGFALLTLGLWYYLYRRKHKKPLDALTSGSVSEISLPTLMTQRSAIFSQQLSIEL